MLREEMKPMVIALINNSNDVYEADAYIQEFCEIDESDFEKKYQFLIESYNDSRILARTGDTDVRTDYFALLTVLINNKWR